jgi:hypothetical protein
MNGERGPFLPKKLICVGAYFTAAMVNIYCTSDSTANPKRNGHVHRGCRILSSCVLASLASLVSLLALPLRRSYAPCICTARCDCINQAAFACARKTSLQLVTLDSEGRRCLEPAPLHEYTPNSQLIVDYLTPTSVVHTCLSANSLSPNHLLCVAPVFSC